MIKKSPILIAIILFSFACKRSQEKKQVNGMPQDFNEFYQLFHTDSIYQMNHIVFPLDGIKSFQSFSESPEKSQFEKEEWKIQHLPTDSLVLYLSQKLLSENIVEEEIGLDERGLMMFRRFSKIGNEWYLIYYMAPNFVQKN